MKNFITLITTVGFMSFVTSANAQSNNYLVVAPHCLTKSFSNGSNTLAATHTLTLLQVNHHELDQLVSAKHQKNACGGFINVTADWNEYVKTAHVKPTSPKIFLEHYTTTPAATNSPKTNYSINYPDQVNQLLKQLNPDNMWANLTTLSNFHDRYSNSDNGVAAANWINAQVSDMVKNSGRTDINIRFIKTGTPRASGAGDVSAALQDPVYKQSSLVVKIGNSNAPGIVIGAHMDTLEGQMPGADDDGTGTVTVLELAKALINSNIQFKKPIYLIWYSAEEEGLIGSTYTEKDFKHQQIGVDAVLNFDMTGFSYQNDPTIWLVKDDTDADLTSFLETLVKTYVKQPVNYTYCGYACSDHATWNRENYKAAFAYEGAIETSHHSDGGMPYFLTANEGEAKDNTYRHTAMDTMEKLSLKHMTDYAKLGLAFAVELAGPTAS